MVLKQGNDQSRGVRAERKEGQGDKRKESLGGMTIEEALQDYYAAVRQERSIRRSMKKILPEVEKQMREWIIDGKEPDLGEVGPGMRDLTNKMLSDQKRTPSAASGERRSPRKRK